MSRAETPPEAAKLKPPRPPMNEWFRNFAGCTARAVGSKYAFALAVLTIIAWATMGPHYRYSDTWQLVINTGTTIVTFLMVFLIQNSQNRDAKAIHLKLDELLRGVKGARTGLVNLEDLSDEDLKLLSDEFQHIRERHAKALDKMRDKAERIAEKSGDPDVVRKEARQLRDVAKEAKEQVVRTL